MAGKRDYYEILGVTRNASKAELDKAYKILALKHHPDRQTKLDSASEEKFKEITEAYQVLSDAKKKAAYDQFGHEGLRGGPAPGAGQGFGGFASDVFGDIFSDLFGGGGGRESVARGPNLKMSLNVAFLDAAFGAEKKITIPRTESCERCSGNGCEPGHSPTTCSTCHGSGQVAFQQGFFTLSRTCNQCGGNGIRIDHPCRTCRGRGVSEKKAKLNVTIPPGINTGQRLKLKNEGGLSSGEGRPGDLYIEIHVEPHDFFDRSDDDIHIKIPITFLQATLGDEIEVPTLHGNVQMKIPPGTQAGRRFRIPNKGVPHVQSRGFGDQFVYIHVETPAHLSTSQKKQLKSLEEALASKNYPLKEAFIKKLSKHAQR